MACLNTHRGRRGVTTVEAALILPLLLTMTFAVCEYGWMLMKSQQVANAARQGARIAAIADGTNESAITAINALMTSAGLDGSGYTVTVTPGDVSALEAGETLSVQVSVPTSAINLTGIALPMPANIQSSVSMAKEAQ